MGPEPLDLRDLGVRVLRLDLLVELPRLVRRLVADNRVVAAPVEPERKRKAGELVDVVEWAALVPERLLARELAEELGDRHVPLQPCVEEGGALAEAADRGRLRVDLLDHAGRDPGRVGAVRRSQIGEIGALRGEVAGRVEGACAGQPAGTPGKRLGVAGREQKRFLSAHAAAQHVDSLEVDPEPGERRRDDLRHPGQVVDPALVAVGEQARVGGRLVERVARLVMGAAEPVRADERERAVGG